MLRILQMFWWAFLEERACRKVRNHRVDLTTWIIQRDLYRHKLAKARKAALAQPFAASSEATAHWPSDEA